MRPKPLERLKDALSRLSHGAAIGWLGERRAAVHLRRHGLRIIARNVRCGRGEIDLIAGDGATLVFVEVKSTTERSFSKGTDKVDRSKRAALRRACRAYLGRTGWRVQSFRVDVVWVEFRLSWLPRVSRIRWYRNELDLD